MESHPLRVRGLKHQFSNTVFKEVWSHPLRVRGLKHYRGTVLDLEPEVASFTGAWIETLAIAMSLSYIWVASFTGAWIETLNIHIIYLRFVSHPLRVRGLKLL